MSPVSQTILAAAALWAATRGPAELQLKLAQYVPDGYLPTLLLALKIFFGYGVLRTLNQYLNRTFLNHWKPLTIGATSQKPWVWKQEVAFISGTSSGFGKDLAKQLAEMGVKVAAVDRNEPPSDLKHPNITFFVQDLTKIEELEKLAEEVRQSVGKPTILINNAGIGQNCPIIDTSDKWIDTIFKVNIISHWKLIKEFMPHMLEIDKGHIIEISSCAAFVSVGGMVDYCATKAGVMALWEGLNQELHTLYRKSGVVTSVVHPSWTDTPIVSKHLDAKNQQLRSYMAKVSDITDPIIKQIKMGRGAQLVLPPLASPASYLRVWPYWVQELFRYSQTKILDKGNENRMVAKNHI